MTAVGPLTAVSLFAGIGGLDLACQQAGIGVRAAVEIDPGCRGVLARHFPATTLFSDVTEVSGDQLRATGFVPGRGVLAAGWPCQGNSVAGRRGGLADPRSGLWRHVVRLLAETRPRWFIGENVPVRIPERRAGGCPVTTPQPPHRWPLAIRCTCGAWFFGRARWNGRAYRRFREHWGSGECWRRG